MISLYEPFVILEIFENYNYCKINLKGAWLKEVAIKY